MQAYRDDLAFVHDQGFGHSATHAATMLISALRSRRIDSGLVLDLGCGTGILAKPVTEAGYSLLGIDISPSMISIARANAPLARFCVGSLFDVEIPPCVAVAAVGECLNYMFDSHNTQRKLSRLFRRIFEAITPGGLFQFDVAEPGCIPGSGPRKTYFEGKDWAVLVNTNEDQRQNRLTRRFITFRRCGELYKRDAETHQLRLMRRSDVARELRIIGFKVRVLSGYGPHMFPVGHVGFLARRP